MWALIYIADIIVGLYKAFVVSKLWVWFIIPVFEIPCPNIFVIYGLLLIVTLSNARLTFTEIKFLSEEEFNGIYIPTVQLTFQLILSTLTLIIGYIIHLL